MSNESIQPWVAHKNHAGLQYRVYNTERSYRFRQKIASKIVVDFLGTMPEEKAVRIAAELRENRSMGTGPQTWKEMQHVYAEQAQHAAIQEQKERKRILAETKQSLENTVAKFWDNVYWPHRSQSGSSHSREGVISAFNKWIRPQAGDIPLVDLTFTDVDKLLKNAARRGLREKSIRHVYTIFQACWNYAIIYLSIHHKINLPVFPGKMIKLPPLNNAKTCYLERDEASLLLNTLYNWIPCCARHGIRYPGRDTKDAYGMAVLSLLSGLRLGDICALTWRDVEMAYGYAREPKGGRAYGIHLDIAMVREMLDERRTLFPGARPEDYVFPDSLGKERQDAPESFRLAVEELGLNFTPRRISNPSERIDFHALRHTFASWLAMAATPLQTIMVLMGHESIQMTLRYARLNPAYTRQPVEELAADFAQQYKKSLSAAQIPASA